jgi:hypothetical protein
MHESHLVDDEKKKGKHSFGMVGWVRGVHQYISGIIAWDFVAGAGAQ